MEPDNAQTTHGGNETTNIPVSSSDAEADLPQTGTVLMHLSLVLSLACLFGTAANSMQLPTVESLIMTLGYLGAYTLVRLATRLRGLMDALFSHPACMDAILVVTATLSAACGIYLCVGEVRGAELALVLVATMGLAMGVQGSLMFSLHAEFSMPGDGRFALVTRMVVVCLGALIALVVMFLQGFVRECTFAALCPISSLIWVFSGTRARCQDARGAMAQGNTFYALATRTHLYWVALMFAFGLAYSIGFRFWSVEWCAGALIACIALGACFPAIKRRMGGGGLGATSRVYLPLCILISFCVSSAAPQVLAAAMALAIVFALFQGLSNITFLVNYARTFNESVIYKLSEGRFPPLVGMFAGVLVGMAMGQLGADAHSFIWIAVPCLAAMLAVFTYTLQIFNQGNPVNEGVVRDLSAGIESLWHTDDAQEMEAFKLRCQKFAQEKGLTPRETEVFFLLACGYNTVSISEVLMVSPSTVKTHFYRIYTKVDMHSQQEIIMHMRG